MTGHVLLCPNAHRDTELKTTRQALQLLQAHGYEVKVSPLLSTGLEDSMPADIPLLPLDEALPGARLVITLGGDGTILQASGQLSAAGVPILGMNMGHKGFLTELEGGDVNKLLDAAAGNFTIQPRMMLDVELHRNGKVVFSGRALNEAVVRALVNVVRVEAYGDGSEITAFSGDGIIVATPTGSTAYSMAAGGPLVEPDADCIILTPICTFRLAARSFVLTANRRVRIRTVEQNDKKVMLSIDGEPVEFLDGDELLVKKSAETLLMAQVSGRSFYDIVFEKLNDQS